MRKKLISVSIVSVVLGLLLIMGLTYGYYQTIVKSNESDKSLSATSKYLAVVYEDGTAVMDFSGDYMFPGNGATKEFTVTNTGTADTTYSIFIEDVVNEFERIQDLRFELYINDELVNDGAINYNEVQYLSFERELLTGAVDNVKFVFEYSETEEIQNMDMNKGISFKFNIDVKEKKEATSSTNSVTFINNNSQINNYRIYGNSLQDTATYGTPTIDNPVEIESVGEKVTSSSNSLVDFYDVFVNYDYMPASKNISYRYIQLEPSTSYTLSTNAAQTTTLNGVATYQIFFAAGKVTSVTGANNGVAVDSPRTVATDSEGYLTIAIRVADGVEVVSESDILNGTKWIMLNEGTTAEEYQEKESYKVPVTVRGKNLFNYITTFNSSTNGVTSVINDDGTITVSGKPTSSYTSIVSSYSITDLLEDGKTYTMSQTATSNKIYLQVVMTNKEDATKTYRALTNNYKLSFKVDKSTYTYTISVLCGTTANWGEEELTITSYYQLEEGSSATSFEPYIEPISFDIYLDEPLRKVGNYADYIDFENQEVVRNVRNISLKVANMNNSESYPGWTGVKYIREDYLGHNGLLGNVTTVLSNITNSNKIAINTLGTNNRVLYLNQFGLTQTEWKTNYPDLIVDIYYGLSVEERIPIKLPTLEYLAGTNAIYVDLETYPSELVVEYFDK